MSHNLPETGNGPADRGRRRLSADARNRALAQRSKFLSSGDRPLQFVGCSLLWIESAIARHFVHVITVLVDETFEVQPLSRGRMPLTHNRRCREIFQIYTTVGKPS